MIHYHLVFRPLECVEAKLDNVLWYKCELLHDHNLFVMGITGDRLMYFEPYDEESGHDTWESVGSLPQRNDLVGSDHEFVINTEGKQQSIDSLVEEMLRWGL